MINAIIKYLVALLAFKSLEYFIITNVCVAFLIGVSVGLIFKAIDGVIIIMKEKLANEKFR
jgi:hypothetical protein